MPISFYTIHEIGSTVRNQIKVTGQEGRLSSNAASNHLGSYMSCSTDTDIKHSPSLNVAISISDMSPDQKKHHPLSPSNRPEPITRRASSFTNSIPGPSRPRQSPSIAQAGYFDLPKSESPKRHHAATVSISSNLSRQSRAGEGDLLGIGPSQKLSKRTGRGSNKSSPATGYHSVFDESDAGSLRPTTLRGDSSGSKPLSTFMDSLSKEEMAVVETRFDQFSDEELSGYLKLFGEPPPMISPEIDTATPRVPSVKDEELSPTTPMPRTTAKPISKGDDIDDQPLFPPSPPSLAVQREALDHPLRILSRAIRELKEAVERLEEENDRLRAMSVKKDTMRRKEPDQVSCLYYGLRN